MEISSITSTINIHLNCIIIEVVKEHMVHLDSTAVITAYAQEFYRPCKIIVEQ